MTGMIERVAKAIYEADDPWSSAFEWPVMGSERQSADEYRRIAKAAIEAMREPTETMLDAGYVSQLPDNWPNPWPADGNGAELTSEYVRAHTAYRAMIDAALAPPSVSPPT